MKRLALIAGVAVCCGLVACGEEPFYDPIVGDYVSVAVANPNLEKKAGTVVALNSQELGYTVTEGASVSYTVTKTKGASEKAAETLEITDGTFTVEEGCFYDVRIDATLGEGSTAEYVQIRDEELIVCSFESSSEMIPIIGSGVVQWQKITEIGRKNTSF
jgi:hypothetical protein